MSRFRPLLSLLLTLATVGLVAGCASAPELPVAATRATSGVAARGASPGANETPETASARQAAPTAAPAAATRPFLWRIEGERPSWLFGTIHLPDQRVTTLAPRVEVALQAADVVVTEIHLTDETRQAVAAAAMLPADQSLTELLPKPLLDRTAAYLAGRGLPFAPFSRMKIWALSTQLALLDYLPQMMMNPPLDMQLHNRAKNAGTRTEGLETVDEQLGIFESLTLEQQIELHAQSLDQLEEAAAEGTSPARELVEAYLSGDGAALLAKIEESVEPGDIVAETMLDSMLTKRNYRMADRIVARLAGEPGSSWFFAVGAGHLPGEEGVVALLRSRGLSVTRVTAAP